MRKPEHHLLYLKLIRDALNRGFRLAGFIVDIGCRLILTIKRRYPHLEWLALPITVGMWHVKVRPTRPRVNCVM